MNSNIYRQADSRWGSLGYPTKTYSFAGNGCGCCACLHVLIEQDKYKGWTPKDLRPYMVDKGFATKGNGTTWAGIKLTLEHYGNKVINHATMNGIFETLNERKNKNLPCLGVILFRSGSKGGVTWTAGGHYVAFVDYKVSNGKHYFYTKDSGGRHHDGWYCYETTMKGLIPQIWSALPNSTTTSTSTSTSSTTTTTTSTKLVEDGVAGTKTIKAAQKLFDTPQTGEFGGQLKSLAQYHKGFGKGVIEYGKGGSALIKAMQKYLQLSGPDGQLGPNTIKETQRMLGIVADGVWGAATSKAFQQWLNSNSTLPPYTPKKKDNVSETKIKGVDISVWQGDISKANFEKAKAAGVKFVILRVGYTGSSSKTPTVDSVFENNYKNAIAAGLPVGVYYYSLATTVVMAQKEAKFIISKLKGKTITYPVYIDMEDNKAQGKASKSALASVCNAFCIAISAAGYKPGVYASLSWFNNKIGSISASHTKWVAQYNSICTYKGTYDMWQYSSSEKVPGIANKTDVNWCYKKF